MRSLISGFLAAQLTILPLSQVVAQSAVVVAQEASVGVVPSTSVASPHLAVADSTRVRLGVPVIDPNSDAARLFAPEVMQLRSARDSIPVIDATARALSTPVRVVIVVGAVLAVAFIALLISCSNACFDS